MGTNQVDPIDPNLLPIYQSPGRTTMTLWGDPSAPDYSGMHLKQKMLGMTEFSKARLKRFNPICPNIELLVPIAVNQSRDS